MDTDILVIGAGPVGLASAIALRQRGWQVAVLDARPAEAGARDPRVLALAHGSRQTLERLGAWPATGWTPISTIHVSQRGAFGRTVIRAGEHGLPALGYVTPAGVLQAALARRAESLGIVLRHDVEVVSLAPEATRLAVQVRASATLHTRLAVCCEGQVAASDAPALIERDYGQHALIAQAEIAMPHGGVAYERFTPEGPLALLPHGNGYTVVWTVPVGRADMLAGLDDARFAAALQEAFGGRVQILGVSARGRFPLALRARRNPVGPRTVWAGNAAQTLHPVAGQGFNLALRDVWSLASMLAPGGDPGDPTMLARHARNRMLDRGATLAFTDGLVQVFSSDDPLLRHLRGAGLAALDLVPPLRRCLARRMLYGARAWP